VGAAREVEAELKIKAAASAGGVYTKKARPATIKITTAAYRIRNMALRVADLGAERKEISKNHGDGDWADTARDGGKNRGDFGTSRVGIACELACSL
jgi:hypothetical protein